MGFSRDSKKFSNEALAYSGGMPAPDSNRSARSVAAHSQRTAPETSSRSTIFHPVPLHCGQIAAAGMIRIHYRVPRALFFERCHIDHEAVFHIALQQAFVGGIDVLNTDHFDVAHDAVFRAEIQHL